MGSISEFSVPLQLFLKRYRWRRLQPVPWNPLTKPLSACRLVLVSSSGLSMPEQARFNRAIKGGDPSYREIPNDVNASTLVETQRSQAWDRAGLREDANVVFPIDRLRELVERGQIGSLNHRHFSFMGSITKPDRLIKKTAPAAVAEMVSDGVDVALLVPV